MRNLPTPVFQSFDDLAATSERLQAADMGFDQSIGMLSAAPRQSASVLLRIVDAGPLGCELSDRSIGGSASALAMATMATVGTSLIGSRLATRT